MTSWQDHADDARARVEANNAKHGVIPISVPMPPDRFFEIRRRLGDWCLVDIDTLAPDAARDMVGELRKVNAEFVANGLRGIRIWREVACIIGFCVAVGLIVGRYL